MKGVRHPVSQLGAIREACATEASAGVWECASVPLCGCGRVCHIKFAISMHIKKNEGEFYNLRFLTTSSILCLEYLAQTELGKISATGFYAIGFFQWSSIERRGRGATLSVQHGPAIQKYEGYQKYSATFQQGREARAFGRTASEIKKYEFLL